mgnify:CR=1 FL=1
MGDSTIHRFSEQAIRFLGFVDFVPGALTRLLVGFAFLDSGRGKLEGMENTVNFFTDLGIPFPELNAMFVARLEYYGGMLLLAGLLTRITAALLSTTMVVALITADRENFTGALARSAEIGLSDIPAFALLVFLSWLVVRGAGALSLDHLASRFLARGDKAEKTG